jgi:phosphoglycerate dehydrogenase-like enzyme
MGRACSTYSERRDAYRILVAKPRKRPRHRLEGSVILKWIFKKFSGGVDWINMSKDKNRWVAVVNAVMNLQFL